MPYLRPYVSMKLNGKQKIEKISLGFKSPKKEQKKIWRELNARHDEFQHILRLLVRYEGEESQTEANWLFHTRQALCACSPEQLRFFLCNIGAYVFHVVAQAEGTGAYLATSWLHEDGIQAERELNLFNKTHPVHHLACVTDFYYESSVEIDLEKPKNEIGEAARFLMRLE